MELTDLERDFLRRLLGESWISPPLFDHETVARLVELGLVETDRVHPEISNTASPTRGGRRLPRDTDGRLAGS
ncbi:MULTISPECIES: hypothetical protein [Bradyrhizobium]|uniref:hypothetical protein n=1 Tax=Bradyrhizobium TaxID=374 RepID=UPI0003F8B9AB|nr:MULTISPECIES: hypothetical protein [Bradyrhizobium]UFW49021.1 hypothetical protein BaraCB756_43495 [Bradyrhizobium arachidis]